MTASYELELEHKGHDDLSLKTVVYPCVCFKGAWSCHTLTEKRSLWKAFEWLIPMAKKQNLRYEKDYSQLNCIYIPKNA